MGLGHVRTSHNPRMKRKPQTTFQHLVITCTHAHTHTVTHDAHFRGSGSDITYHVLLEVDECAGHNLSDEDQQETREVLRRNRRTKPCDTSPSGV